MTDVVWYAAYGSNLSVDRLGAYLVGGRPPGARMAHPGCRRPPREIPHPRPLQVSGGVHFAGESPVWGGAMAFFDPTLPGTARVAAYRLDRDQMLDVAAQEMHLAPGTPTDQPPGDLVVGTSVRLWPGRYGTVHVLTRIGDEPVVTLSHDDQPIAIGARPSDTYLGWIIRGLHTVHRLAPSRLADYLAGCPGIGRDHDELRDLIRGSLGTTAPPPRG